MMYIGCRRSPGDDPQGAAPDTGTAALSPQDEQAKQFESGFQELRARLERSPDPVAKKQFALRAFIQQAKAFEANTGRKLAVVASAEAEIEKLTRGQEKEAEDAYRQFEGKVLALLDGPERDVDQAARVLEEFPGRQSREGGPLAGNLEALRQKVELYQKASIDAIARKGRAQVLEDPVQAIAILEGFDPAYDKTPFADEIRALIRENYARYAEAREGKESGGAQPGGGAEEGGSGDGEKDEKAADEKAGDEKAGEKTADSGRQGADIQGDGR